MSLSIKRSTMRAGSFGQQRAKAGVGLSLHAAFLFERANCARLRYVKGEQPGTINNELLAIRSDSEGDGGCLYSATSSLSSSPHCL